MVEFANRLVARGHDVTIFVPRTESPSCSWMPCHAAVRHVEDGHQTDLDLLIFNDEPQWYLLERFPRARRKIFYALHYGRLYDKPGSWEALRAPVDLILANSDWTAGMIESEIGRRPTVVLPGIDHRLFRPHAFDPIYPILCTGDRERRWKGTDTIDRAGRILGLPVEGYAPKDLDQPSLSQEYGKAEVFAVGSWFEGFGLPGLEALACGVPLVTTDNGGCREYARDRETALVVAPRDPEAMAAAIGTLRDSPGLARRLVANGLDVVRGEFDWERRTDTLEEVLEGATTSPSVPTVAGRPSVPDRPSLSVVVLAWDNLELTQACVESVRQHTDVSYELIIVDNGSRPDAAAYARQAADIAVLNTTNLGFAAGMNRGLDRASGEFVAFCNNDIVLPAGWASNLVESARRHPEAGIVVPALDAASNPATVRSRPGDMVQALRPFSSPPPAVVYLMRTTIARAVRGWNEDYRIASGEDTDLAFTIWTNDLGVVLDERVLVEHVGGASARLLGDWRDLWDRNRTQFLERWQDPSTEVVRLESCDPARFARNRDIASATAEWMGRFFDAQRVSQRHVRWRWHLRIRVEGALRRTLDRAEHHRSAAVARTAARLRRELRRRRPGGVGSTG
jgi:glycosyltransferase involved in cell wall biosynthesis/GT2 family glycosyltransferase